MLRVLPRLPYGLTTLTILILDQVTKQMISSRMEIHSSRPIVPGFLHLTFVTNTGALFGILRDLPTLHRAVLFTAVPIMAIALILYFQYRTTLMDVMAQTGLALILGGALGNLIDRLRLGFVIDFIDVFIGSYHWPAFNVADSSICIGVSLLVVDVFRQGRHRRATDDLSRG